MLVSHRSKVHAFWSLQEIGVEVHPEVINENFNLQLIVLHIPRTLSHESVVHLLLSSQEMGV